MCYDSEAEAYAQGEYEEQKAQYYSDLIRDQNYDLYAYETMIEELSSPRFKRSGKSAVDYLIDRRNEHVAWLQKQSERLLQSQQPKDDVEDDLPF